MDLIDPGLGSQIVDIQPGIQPNGLFWTTMINHHGYRPRKRTTQLRLTDLPLVETFQFGSPLGVPAQASCNLLWRETGPRTARGSGSAADPLAMDAFEGSFSDAVCTGWVKAERMGLTFESHDLTSAGYYASVGEEANGAFLS